MRLIAPCLMTALGACVSPCGEGAKPAVLALGPDDSLAGVIAVLAPVEGRSSLALGPPDPRTQPIVTILPPALTSNETRSTALPTVYDIALENGACALTRRADDLQIALPRDIPCTPYLP
ncbi:MAG: hypothetical protein AAF225_02650 [Pseudomonadota bacterium]